MESPGHLYGGLYVYFQQEFIQVKSVLRLLQKGLASALSKPTLKIAMLHREVDPEY